MILSDGIGYIQVEHTAAPSTGKIETFKKGTFRTVLYGNYLYLVFNNIANPVKYADAFLVLNYAEVTSPVTASNTALRDAILAWDENDKEGLAISKGDVNDTSFIHKFGYTPDFDTADLDVTIWDGADDANIDQMKYVYSTTADIDSLVSSSAADDQDIEIQGLDTDWNMVTQTITLNGQTRVALTTPLLRVFRMVNRGTTDTAGYIYCYVNSAITAGVPDDSTQVRAIIEHSNNQTLMAVYSIPAGYTGYMRDWYAAVAGDAKDSTYIIDLKARPFGEVFQLKHRSAIADTGTSQTQHRYTEPEVFAAKTDIEMRARMTAVGGTGAAVSGGFDIVLIKI